MESTPDILIFGLILLLRFTAPLCIPKYPLPAIILCLFFDAADQTLLQLFTSSDLSGYQAYDKALDIFYLSIAMLTTLRNWSHHSAVIIARILFYSRLLGVLIFELTEQRYVLLLFPNVFEYFFICYEAIRTRWTADRIETGSFLRLALFIGLFLKLPQEYWLHIAQLDATDLIKTRILGVSANSMAGEFISYLIIFTLIGLLALIVIQMAKRYARPADHTWAFPADPLPENIDEAWERNRCIAERWRILDRHLAEKIVLSGFVSVIFSQMLPEIQISSLRLFLGTAVFVFFNCFLLIQHAHKGRSIESAVLSFILLAWFNSALAFLTHLFIQTGFLSLPGRSLLFFLLLLTLIVTLYDRWRPVYEVRFRPS